MYMAEQSECCSTYFHTSASGLLSFLIFIEIKIMKEEKEWNKEILENLQPGIDLRNKAAKREISRDGNRHKHLADELVKNK